MSRPATHVDRGDGDRRRRPRPGWPVRRAHPRPARAATPRINARRGDHGGGAEHSTISDRGGGRPALEGLALVRPSAQSSQSRPAARDPLQVAPGPLGPRVARRPAPRTASCGWRRPDGPVRAGSRSPPPSRGTSWIRSEIRMLWSAGVHEPQRPFWLRTHRTLGRPGRLRVLAQVALGQPLGPLVERLVGVCPRRSRAASRATILSTHSRSSAPENWAGMSTTTRSPSR